MAILSKYVQERIVSLKESGLTNHEVVETLKREGPDFHSDGRLQSLQHSGMVLLHQMVHLKVEVVLYIPAQVVQHSEDSYSLKKLASL